MKVCTILLLCIGFLVVSTIAEESVQEPSVEVSSELDVSGDTDLDSEAESEEESEEDSEEDDSDFDLELDELSRRCRRRNQRVSFLVIEKKNVDDKKKWRTWNWTVRKHFDIVW